MSATEETPRRQSPTEAIRDVAIAALHRASTPEYDCSLTLNAKGDVQIAVTGKADTLDVCDAVRAKFDELCAAYPRRNGGEA